MADIRIERHGDRWAVREGDGTPFFESYTREEAVAEARRRAGKGGRVTVAGGELEGAGEGQRSVAADAGPEADQVREAAQSPRPGGTIRREQGSF